MTALPTPASAAADTAVYGGRGYAVTVQALLLSIAVCALTVPVWWGAIARERGYDLVMFSTIQTVNAAVGFVVGTWLAVYVQRLNRRVVMVICGLAMTGTELLTIVAVDPIALYAVRSANTAAMGVAAILGMVYLGYTREPAKSYGWYTTLQALVQSVGLFFVPVIARTMGFSGLQVSMAVPGLLVAALAMQLPARAPQAVLVAGAAATIVPPIRWLPAVPALFAMVAFGFYTNDFFGYSERFGNARGLDPERIGLILSITTAAGIPGSLFVSWLGNRMGTLRPIVIGSAFGIVAALLLLAPQYGEAGYWLALIIFSLVWSFVLPYLFALLSIIDPVGRLMIATQPIRAGVNVVLTAGLAAAIAYGGLTVVAWLAAAAIALCPVLVALALAFHRRTRESA